MKLNDLPIRARALLAGFLISIIPTVTIGTFFGTIHHAIIVFIAILIISFTYGYRVFRKSQSYLRTVLHSIISGLLAIMLASFILAVYASLFHLGLVLTILTAPFIILDGLIVFGIPTIIFMWLVGSAVYLCVGCTSRNGS